MMGNVIYSYGSLTGKSVKVHILGFEQCELVNMMLPPIPAVSAPLFQLSAQLKMRATMLWHAMKVL
jgi:hypothetical protein